MTGGQLGGITQCNINFFRLLLLLVNGGKDVLHKLFNTRLTPNTTVDSYLQSYKPTLDNLKNNKRKITPTQWDLLFPVAKPDEWDISIWCLLLGNICGISPPGNWTSPPSTGDVSLEADLVRLRLFRNDICHVADAQADSKRFQTVWKDISAVLLRLADHDQLYTKTLEKTIEAYKEGPLPTSSEQSVFLLELKGWLNKDGMDEVDSIKSVLSEFMDMIAQLEPRLVNPLLDACNKIMKTIENLPTVEQVDSKVERYGVQWNSIITGIIDDLDRMVERCGNKFKRVMKNKRKGGSIVNARYTEVKKTLATFSKIIKGFKRNHVDNMKILFEMMESQVKLSHTMLANQYKIMQNQAADQTETRAMWQDVMNCLTCTRAETGDKREKREGRQTACAGGAGIVMGCGHRFDADDLDDYLQHLLYLGHTSLTCYKEICRTEWDISELRHKLQWTDEKYSSFQETLSRNYFATADIKECPSCRSYCTRQDDRDIRVRCLLCRRFEFCWGCGQEWGSDTRHVACGGVGRVHGRYTALSKVNSRVEREEDRRKTIAVSYHRHL